MGKYITLSKEDCSKFSADRDFLDYEPINVITQTIGKVAKKVAEDMDKMLIEACVKVDVDPDALLNTMKRVRAQEAEISKLESEIERLKSILNDYALQYGTVRDQRKVKSEMAMEIFEDIDEDCFDQFGYFEYEAYSELKEEYREDENHEN